MKVELDLSSEQLTALDNSLVDLISSLNEDQKIDIVKTYINFQFNKLYEKQKNYYGREEDRLSQFGEDLIKGLQRQIDESITETIMSDENLKKVLDDEINDITSNLKNIVDKAITTYVVDKLFCSKDNIQNMIHASIYELRDRGILH